MVKHGKAVIIVCLAVVIVCLAGLCVWLITGNLFGVGTGFSLGDGLNGGVRWDLVGGIESGSGDYVQRGTYSVGAEGVGTLRLDWTAGAVSVAPYDGAEITLTEYARRELSDSEKLSYSVQNGTLSVRYTGQNTALGISMPSKRLEIQLPRALAQKLTLLSVDGVSADISLSDLGTGALDANTTSGEITLKNLSADSASLGTVSGEMALSGASVRALTANTTSGDCSFAGSFQNVQFDSVSGDMTLSSAAAPESLKSHTVSGDVTVLIPETEGLSVSQNSVSGDFNSDLAVKLLKSGGAYDFSSVSGDARIGLLGG